MKRFVWKGVALVLVAFAAVGWWVFGPPLVTRNAPISPAFIAWLKSEHPPALSDRLIDPLEVTLRLLYFGESDQIDTNGMTISVREEDNSNCVVTIDDRSVEDDSTSRSYSWVRLRKEGFIWFPVEHRVAQQGRGVFGWTTGATH